MNRNTNIEGAILILLGIFLALLSIHGYLDANYIVVFLPLLTIILLVLGLLSKDFILIPLGLALLLIFIQHHFKFVTSTTVQLFIAFALAVLALDILFNKGMKFVTLDNIITSHSKSKEEIPFNHETYLNIKSGHNSISRNDSSIIIDSTNEHFEVDNISKELSYIDITLQYSEVYLDLSQSQLANKEINTHLNLVNSKLIIVASEAITFMDHLDKDKRSVFHNHESTDQYKVYLSGDLTHSTVEIIESSKKDSANIL